LLASSPYRQSLTRRFEACIQVQGQILGISVNTIRTQLYYRDLLITGRYP
jgi:hypothetical protein